MKREKIEGLLTLIAGRGSIIVFFIMAFEIMIMISPFAFFFYSVFNPIFRWLDQYPATQWLTSFFLPHMILPPTIFLKSVRILGSIFFIIGFLSFLICALQVYLGKIFKWGIASRGLYRYIRHPQYLSLGIWGIGMSILWPRFIVLATLSLMFILYYFLAKDEEGRMSRQYGESYEKYMAATGRFFPIGLEKQFAYLGRFIPQRHGYLVAPLLIIGVVLGSGFILRTVTLDSLSLQSQKNLTLVSMLPEDNALTPGALKGIIDGSADGKLSLIQNNKSYLGYLMYPDYVMQGMIANTGGEFHLYKQHHTFAMITEWVLHPFQHLRNSPVFHMAKMHHVDPEMARRHHCPLGINDPSLTRATCPYRRVIIVEVSDKKGSSLSGKELFAFGVNRLPVYSVDINTKTGEIVKVLPVERSTAWKDVPTPAI